MKSLVLNEAEMYNSIPKPLNYAEFNKFSFEMAKILPVVMIKSAETFRAVSVTAAQIDKYLDLQFEVKRADNGEQITVNVLSLCTKEIFAKVGAEAIFDKMSNDLKESILCPTQLNDLIVSPSSLATIDGSPAPNHNDYVELVVNRCQHPQKPTCDNNNGNLDQDMRKIHFVLATVG